MARSLPYLECDRLLGSDHNALALWKLSVEFPNEGTVGEVQSLLMSKRGAMREGMFEGVMALLGADDAMLEV